MTIKELQGLAPEYVKLLHEYDKLLVVVLLAAVAFIMSLKARRDWSWLDAPLMRWGEKDVFTVRDLLSHVIWMGSTGSGKTSSAEHLQMAIMKDRRCGMLCMGAKPEDRARFLVMAKKCGRKVRVFGPGHPLRFGLMEYLSRHGVDARNITKVLMVASEGLMGGEKGGDWRFWEQNNERVLLYTISTLLLAYGQATLPNIQRFINEHATSRADLASDGWKRGFQNQTLKLAFQNAKTPSQKAMFDQCEQFWLGEWTSMPDKTRGSILTGVMTILSVYNSGDLHELFSTTTNFSIDELFDGALIYVDASPTTHGQVGVICSTTLKYLAEWRIIQRAPGRNVAVLWVDEFQQYVNSFDADFLAQARSHGGAMVCLTQGTQALIAKLKNEHEAAALLTGFNTRVFNSLGSHDDAEWAADLIGRRPKNFYSGSTAPATSAFDELIGTPSRFTASFSQQMEHIVPPTTFMNGLRRGGHLNKRQVDAIVSRTGQEFSNGENHLFVTFTQRK